MPINEASIVRIEELMKSKSDKDICKTLGINSETLSRYKRMVRQRNGTPKALSQPAKVLLLDIETLPAEVYVWRMWDQNVAPDQVISPTCMLGYAVKWLFLPDVYSDILTPQEAMDKNDKRIVEGIWKWVDDADIICAHNGRAFDTQYINARFIKWGMTPPSPYKTIDTLYIKKCTRFDMNNLDFLCRELGLRPKIDAGGFQLWRRCAEGEKEALKEMQTYNEGDVLSLEELYVRLRPWLPHHPNLALYVEGNDSLCPRCISGEWEYVGYYSTQANLYKSFRCKNCGTIMRSRQTSTPKVAMSINCKSNLLINTCL